MEKEAVSEAAPDLEFTPLPNGEQLWTSVRLVFALPWRRFKKGSILTMKVRISPSVCKPPFCVSS